MAATRTPEEKARRAMLARCARYGVSPEWFSVQMRRQGGKCALCGRPPNGHKTLVIDHCHRTGRVRGLLHSGCNTAIGLLRDDPKLMRSAIRYLADDEEDTIAGVRMGSVYNRGTKAAPNWWVKYKDENGKWRAVGTGTRNREEAVRFLETINARLRRTSVSGMTGGRRVLNMKGRCDRGT